MTFKRDVTTMGSAWTDQQSLAGKDGLPPHAARWWYQVANSLPGIGWHR